MDIYKKTKENYDTGMKWHIQKSSSYNWNNQINKFVKRLKGNRILDAGCGCGRDIKEFIKLGFRVDGVDYSKKTIKECKKQFPQVTFYERDIRQMGIPNNEYDGIWACASLLNLKKENIPIALSEFKRVLKPKGELFISVKKGRGERIVPDKIGERFFSFYKLDEIKELVEKAGFKIVSVEIIKDSELTGNEEKPIKPDWICIYAVNF